MARRRVAWGRWLSRTNLHRLSREEVQWWSSWPMWARKLCQSSGLDLMDSVDLRVRETLRTYEPESRRSPIDPDRLAKALNASVVSVAGATPSGNWRPRRDSRYGGFIRPLDAQRWEILVQNAHPYSRRFSLAHELSHLLLYRTPRGIDLEAWEASHTSLMEEGICNYMAGSLLAPAHLVSHLRGSRSNAARWIVRGIAKKFEMPLFPATARGLDLAVQRGKPFKVAIYWAQRCPFSQSFVESCVRQFPDMLSFFQGVALDLRVACHEWPLRSRWQVWADAVLLDRSDRLLVPTYGARVQRIVDTVRAWLAHQSDRGRCAAARQLASSFTSRSYAPMHILWADRNPEDYVMPNAGGAHPASIVARVAGQHERAAAVGIEEVQIGTLRGRYEVHAFAFGDASVGRRHVLTLYRPVEPGQRYLFGRG